MKISIHPMKLFNFAFLILHSVAAATAGTILHDYSGPGVFGWGVFEAPYFKGQTFLAEDPFLSSIGVKLMVVNPQFADTTVNLSLFSGHAFSGPLIAQRSITPALGLEHSDVQWVDFDLTGVVVSPGEMYTLIIQSPVPYWAAQWNQWAFPGRLDEGDHESDYPGGMYLTDRRFAPESDMFFRVVPVPEPSTVLLFMTGLISAFGVRRFIANSRPPH